MAEELSDYDKYNTLNAQLNGPIKPKKDAVIKAPKVNKYEALRQSGVESSVIGRNQSDVNPTDDGPGEITGGENINESRAFNQSATENIFSGLTKGTGLMGTTLANTFIGLPVGIAEASYSGLMDDQATKAESFSKVYDNEITRNMEKMNTNMEKWFPNYYSEKEQKAKVLSWDNLGSSNFWGDKVLKNTGFTAGAILGGGLVSKAIRGTAWLSRALVGANELTEGALLARFNALVGEGMDAAVAAKKVATGVRALNNTAALATSTIVSAGEASAEALQAKTELKKSLDEQWKLDNPGKELDEETHILHNQLASKAGNATMGVNMALLMGTETFQFGKLWAKGFTPEVKRAGQLALKDGLVEVAKPGIAKRIAKGVGTYASNGLAEGFEEGTQTATQAAAKDYYGRIYDKDAIGENNRATHAVLSGLQATFGQKDGLESMLLGAITGVGSHMATKGASYLLGKSKGLPSDDVTAQKFASTMNAQFQSKIPFLHAGIRAASINKEMEDNAKSPNPSRVKHENLSHDNLKALVQPFIQADRFDLLEDKLNNELAKEDEEFKAEYPDVDTKKSSKEYVGKIIRDAKRLKDNWDNLDEMFPKIAGPIKERLWSLLSDIQNKDERIKDLNLQTFAKSGVNFDGVQDYLTKVQQSYDAGNVGVDTKKAEDIVALDAEKKATVEEYKATTQPEVQEAILAQEEVAKEEVASLPVDEEGKITDKPVEDTQNTEEGNPVSEGEISQPEASNDVPQANSDEQDMADSIIASIESKENKLKDILAYLDQEIQDPDNDADSIQRVKQLIEDHFKPKEVKVEPVVEQPKEEPVQETQPVVEDSPLDGPSGLDSIIAELEKGSSSDKTLAGQIALVKQGNTAAGFQALKVLEQLGRKDLVNRLFEELTKNDPKESLLPTMESAPTQEEVEEEQPNIIEDDAVQNDYSEMDKMSSTAMRTTANHQEAIDEGINSVLRYQNFINNPNTSLTGLRLKVITKADPLYDRLLNKKQRAFEEKRKAEGKEVNGILAVVVNSKDDIIMSDTSGALLDSGYEEGDIDDEFSGPLVTTLVSNAEAKDSGFNTVSYQHFGRVNGLGNTVTEDDVKNLKHPAYVAWNAHKQSVAFTREAIQKGEIKYLKITDTSPGIFQNNKVANSVGETLGIDVNDSRLSFVIPKVEDIGSTKGTTTLGPSDGLSKEHTVKVGKPYLIYNGKLFPLNARRLSGDEVENVAKMFELAIANPDRQKYFLSKIKELVFIKAASLKSILNGELTSDDLREYLADRYRQIDAKALAANPKGKYAISSITDKGVNTKKEESSYRDFILSGEEPPITINYNPHPTTVKDKPNYLNGYLVYSPVEEKVEEKVVAKEEPIQTTVEEVVTKSEGKELTKAQKLEENRRRKAALAADDDNSKLARKISLQDSTKKEDIGEAQKWFSDRFNGESFEVVSKIINGNAFGEYSAAATKLFEGAEEGTIYHEAFHKVTQEYLTPKQVASLYDAVRKNVNSKFSDLEAEEWLAEEFRKFVLNGQKSIKNMPYTNNVFRKLYNWLKSFITGKTTPQQVFDKLASKKGYTGAKRFDNAQFTKLERPIPNTTHAQTRDIVSSVNSHFFARLFAAGYTPDEILGEKGKKLIDGIYGRVYKDLYKTYLNEEENYLEDLHTEEEWAAIKQHYTLMLNMNENDEPTSLNLDVQKAHIEYLQGLGIAIKLSDKESQQEREANEEATEVDETDKVENGNAESDDRSRDSAYDKNSNEESSINSAPNSIKLLIMSLPAVDKEGKPLFNSIGGPQLNDYLQTMKLLYANLNGLSQFHEMYAKMQELAPRFPVFTELLNRLGEPGSNKELNQFLLENDFRQAFSKFESRGTITLINPENGEVYQVDANANKLKDRIKENWTSNLRVLSGNKDSYIKKREDGMLALDKSFVTDAKAGKFKDNYKELLRNLGVEFTDLTQGQVQALPDIKNTVNTIFKYLAKAVEEGKTINDLFSKDADIKGQMDKLQDIEVPLSKETVELSYISAEGKRIYAVSLNNYYSLVVNALNNGKTRDELFEKYPHLNNPYTQNSVWIKNLFDAQGNKIPGQRIYMNTVSGLKIQNDNDSGVGATKMEPSDKIVQEFNDLLTSGSTSLIRAADKSSEYAFGITSYGEGQKLAIPLEDISKEGFATSKVHEIFIGYFNDELNRIRAFKNGVGKNIAIYSKQAGDFSLFADILSPETLKSIEPYKSNDEEIDALLEAKINKDLVNYLEVYALGKTEDGKVVEKGVKQYMQDRKVGIKTSKGFTGINSAIATTKEQLDAAIKTFTVNHLVNMIEQSKLLVGDSAFYKDKIKRISSGTGTKKFAASSKLVDNWLNNFYKNEVGRQDGKVADGKLNVVIFDDVKAQLDTFEDYVQALIEKGVSEEKAKEILKAYTEMDEGDAQGWITLDEYREFFMRVGGAYWTEKHEAQYRYEVALEKGEDAGEDPHFYFMPIKAQHMGPQNIDGLYAPAFHKYSLSPLYHSLVKGRNMEKMLTDMREKKIGYALFGSGSKVGTPLNAEGKLPSFYNEKGELSGIQADTPVQQIFYENLGIQLDIAPKVKESLIFGSQTRKLVFSNIFGENTKPEFKKLGEEYNKIIDNLVTYEFDKLTKKLGLKVSKNEDGSYKAFTFNGDYRKLVNQLKEQLEDKDTADNILDSLQVNEDGSLKYPIDSLVNRSKIESMLFTIVNSKVIKQKMNGNSLVQLASSGFENTGKREMGTSNYLKFYTNKGKGGTTTAMEVEVPMNKNFKPLLDKYKTIEALNQAIADGKIDSKHLQMIGYRIPTQGLNSMDVMTIKRFMPTTSGIAIILPTGVVAKSGGDYDIDKLNIFMPNLFYDEKTDYVGAHALSKNSQGQDYKKAAQNKVIDIMSEVLTHPDNFIDLTTPNTTDDLVNLTAKIRAAQGNKGVDKASMTKQFRFDYLMEQFTYFLGGKAALGIAATHNTHHVVSQIAKVKLNALLPFKHNQIIGHTNLAQIDLSQVYTQGGQKITDIINQFINAYVDVAKDPFYKDLNAGTEVSSVWMYMLRAGVDLETIGYFMTQPIILDYVNARKLNRSLVTKSNNGQQGEKFVDLSANGRQKIAYKIEMSDNKDFKKRWKQVLENGSIYNDLLAKYGNVDTKYAKQDFSGDDAKEKLIALIGTKTKDATFKDAQTYLLEQFLEIEKQAGELTKLMQATNNDTTKVQNYGSIYKRQQVESEVNESEVVPKGTIEDIHKKTIVGSFNKTKEFGDMYKELTLYTKYPAIKSTIDDLVSQIPSKSDWDKEYTKIQNHFIGYLLQKYGKTVKGESISSKVALLSGDNSLARQLMNLRKENLIENNPLFDELVGIINADSKGIDNVKLYSRRMGAFESNVMTEAFRSMLGSNNPRIVEFAQDLAYATILQSGLQNSPITFTELIPFEFYNALANQAISEVSESNQEQVATDFYKAFGHNTSSNYGYRLQDYGISESPKIKKQEEVLPQQSDDVVQVTPSENPRMAKILDYINNSEEDLEDLSIGEIEDKMNEEKANKPAPNQLSLFNVSATQNAIRDTNTIANKSEEDGEVNKTCKL